MLVLDFPARSTEPCATPEALVQGLGETPLEVRRAKSYMAIFARQKDIVSIKPDMHWPSQLDSSGIIVTAPGDKVDFVSRFFAPKLGIPRDPVTIIPLLADSILGWTVVQEEADGAATLCSWWRTVL